MSNDFGHTHSPGRRSGAVAGLSLAAFIGTALVVRVLTDDRSAPNSRQTGSLNLSGVIAVLFILLAILLVLRNRRGVLPAVLAAVWLGVWTAVAIGTRGASTETLREGVREASVVALGLIVYSARGALSVPLAARLVQIAGAVPAVVALFQLANGTGMDVAGHIRSNGTFAHPNSAAMFFAVAGIVSLWRYLDCGRRLPDAVLTALFVAALIATYSIDGLVTLVAMLLMLGALRPGRLGIDRVPFVIAGLLVLVFFATPLGSARIASESATNLASAERGEANSTLAWRLNKWKTLLPGWEHSPVYGQGLGTTVTEEPIFGNEYAGDPPHNEYLRYLVETGVIGLAVLIGPLALLIRGLVRRRRVSGTVEAGTLNAPLVALVVLAGCMINALADNTVLYSTASYAAALIIGAALCLPPEDSSAADLADGAQHHPSPAPA